MEFCPQLSAFQGVIISADNVHPFSRLTSRGGKNVKVIFSCKNGSLGLLMLNNWQFPVGTESSLNKLNLNKLLWWFIHLNNV